MIYFKQSLTVIAVGLILSGCGGSSENPTTPQPVINFGPSAKITTEDSIYENHRLVLSGEESSDSEGPIQSFLWELDSPERLAISLSNANQATTELIVGELTEDTEVNIKLTVRDSGGLIDDASFRITLHSIEGNDDNNDGVRDDIENLIESLYFRGDPIFQAAHDVARLKQANYSDPTLSEENVRDNYSRASEAAICIMFADPGFESKMAQIELAIVNSPERQVANRVYNEKLAMLGAFAVPRASEVDQLCSNRYGF